MNLNELVTQVIREVLDTYKNATIWDQMKGPEAGPMLQELARLFSVDMEKLLEEYK